ncbi:MAG: hypothetical protein JNL97_15745 [Verrucomicrobiales bacterium]|nr:hypothetical protein [Verrucomicrobiales bacterium]
MTIHRPQLPALAVVLAAGFFLGSLLRGTSGFSAEPGSLPLQAQLIWGTDSEKPAEKSLAPIPPDLDKRLRRIFKWQNYFEVTRTNFVVATSKPSQIEMSRECRIEIAHQAGGEVEIQLFGKGRLVVKKRQRFVPGETVVIAGDDKDYNAWFVVLTQQKGR